jgi:zinc transport system permease protein
VKLTSTEPTAIVIGWINLRWREHEDTLISVMWSVGMAVGIVFVAKTPGYTTDLMSYLFGNILMLSPTELYWMAILDVVLMLLVWWLRRPFLALCFDEEYARLRGVPVVPLYMLLLCMVAVTVVVLTQVVGLILVIALLTLPAAIAGQFTRRLHLIMFSSIGLGMLLTSGGLALSFGPDLPTGATIILLAGAGYLGALLLKRLRA